MAERAFNLYARLTGEDKHAAGVLSDYVIHNMVIGNVDKSTSETEALTAFLQSGDKTVERRGFSYSREAVAYVIQNWEETREKRYRRGLSS